MIRVDGAGEHKLIDHPADDFDPIWTPDGRGLVFRSNRRGPTDVWFVRVKDGRVSDQPVLAKTDVERELLSITRNGSVLYSAHSGTRDIQVGHDADTSLGTEAADLWRCEVPDVPGAQDVCLPVRCRVQHRIVSGI